MTARRGPRRPAPSRGCDHRSGLAPDRRRHAPARVRPADPRRRGTLTAETDEEQWLTAAYSLDALLTARGNGLPTSSSSAPPIMAIMLERLDLRPGHRVLEIGTGTGYNAALMCRRVGDCNVVSVDIDAEVVGAARTRLAELGQHPTIETADGNNGVPVSAPYDRILVTCAATHISPAWIRQLQPGGRIVTPLTNDAMAVLTKTAPDEVSGRSDATPAFFMPLRHPSCRCVTAPPTARTPGVHLAR